MALSPRTTRLETFKAAITLLAGLLLLGFFAVLLGNQRFWESYNQYTVRFASIQDLSLGREVKYGGLNVGKVLAYSMDPKEPGMIVVTLGVRPKFVLHRGVMASIAQQGLVGDNYVLLELDPPAGDPLPPGSELPAKNVVGIQQLANLAGELMMDLGPKLTSIATSVEKLLDEENTQGLRQALAKLPALVDRAYDAVDTLDSEFAGLTQTLRSETTRSVDNISKASQRMIQSLDNIDATVIAARQVLLEVGGELDTTLTEVRPRLTATLDAAHGLTTDLSSDLEYDQARLLAALEELEAASREVRLLARSLREEPYRLLYKPQEAD